MATVAQLQEPQQADNEILHSCLVITKSTEKHTITNEKIMDSVLFIRFGSFSGLAQLVGRCYFTHSNHYSLVIEI